MEGRKEGRKEDVLVVLDVLRQDVEVQHAVILAADGERRSLCGHLVSRNIQYKTFIQQDIPAHNIQSARIFQYKIFNLQGYSSTKYSVSKDIPIQNI